MTYERGVWYDFSQDRRLPLASRVVWLERDADAVLCRDLRLAEMTFHRKQFSTVERVR